MNIPKKLALFASAALAALAAIVVAQAATVQQDLEFDQPDDVYVVAAPSAFDPPIAVSLTAEIEDSAGSLNVLISVVDNGVCEVVDGDVPISDVNEADVDLELLGYGDCTVTVRRPHIVYGGDAYPSRSVTRTFKVLRDEPVTSSVVGESLSGLPIIVPVEGKYHLECDDSGLHGFKLRSFPTKGVLGGFINFVCIDDGNGGSVFQAQIVYTPLAGSKGVDVFHYAAVVFSGVPNELYDSTPGSASITLTPAVTVPGAPVLTSVSPIGNKITVIFQAPASDGNSPVLDYSIVAFSPSGLRGTTVPAGQTFGSIEGLEDGDSYSVYVTARNAAGTGPASNQMSATIDDKPETAGYGLVFRWNLVSWAGADGIPVADALAGTGANEAGNNITGSVVAVYGWSGASQRWLAYFPAGVNTPGANDLAVLTQGQPYWVAVAGAVSWAVQVD